MGAESRENSYRISDCEVLDLPQFSDERGKLTYIEQDNHVPFEIKRVYYLYDVPADKVRGEHAHKELRQILIPLNGSLKVEVDDGEERKEFSLDAPNEGLYIPPMMWRELKQFSENAVCLVIADDYYDEDDYIHDYSEFCSVSEGN